ncbi:nuclear transport factor 2 family protein [Gillisia sp. CAL575]|uniref:nuclear transport factor 2 family protein n=1 Tax=Gillisia sp. CAL575 TaxID=985255 RepID=UPI0003A267D1|nr:nuclear transport factor 2 family protein [Gillisia sp. CAL575]
MMHKELIQKFYNSFSDGNAKGMIACYHKDIIFQDPAFGILRGKRAKDMWEMLLSNKDSNASINYEILEVDDKRAKIFWKAEYKYGPKRRAVVNEVTANFIFKDGKILKHIDDFNLWAWSKQALGASGYLLGWSSYMKHQIQKKTEGLLSTYIDKRNSVVSAVRN